MFHRRRPQTWASKWALRSIWARPFLSLATVLLLAASLAPRALWWRFDRSKELWAVIIEIDSLLLSWWIATPGLNMVFRASSLDQSCLWGELGGDLKYVLIMCTPNPPSPIVNLVPQCFRDIWELALWYFEAGSVLSSVDPVVKSPGLDLFHSTFCQCYGPCRDTLRGVLEHVDQQPFWWYDWYQVAPC